MTIARVLWLSVALLAAPTWSEGGDAVRITLPPDQGVLAPGPGMEVTRRTCQMCHSLDYVTQQPRGGEGQWRGVVTKMMKVYGAPVSDQDAKTIAEYLATHYGAAR